MKRGLLYNAFAGLIAIMALTGCNNNAGVETVIVKEAGTLSQQLNGSRWANVKKLAIEGPLNEIDIAFLKTLDCHGLESLDLSKVEKLEHIMFYFDSNMFSSITLPDNVETIEDESFQGCLNLKEIKISSNNTHFKLIDGVLYSSDSSRIIVYPALSEKKSFKISANVKRISNCLFASAKELETIEVSNENHNFFSKDGVLFTKDTTNLIAYPAAKKDTAFTLPKEVINVNWSAFWGAKSLKSIKVENGNNFFKSLDGILVEKNDTEEAHGYTLVTFPAGKTSSFYKLPNGITQINTCALKTCTIDTLMLDKDLHFIDKWAFNGANIKHLLVDKENASFTSESGVLYKGNTAYVCSPLSEEMITIKPTTSIDERAFQRCRIASLTINNTYVTGPFLCSYCNNLKEVKLENGIKETQGMGAFFCCPELNSIDLPESFEKLSNRMLFGCINLKTIICRAKKAPAVDKYAFTGVDVKACTLYVPAESIEEYRNNNDWKLFGSIKPINN